MPKNNRKNYLILDGFQKMVRQTAKGQSSSTTEITSCWRVQVLTSNWIPVIESLLERRA
jgi:hypothetical protein